MAEPQTSSSAVNSRPNALFERPAMGVLDEPAFAAVKAAIANSFAPANVQSFLKSLERSGLRIRNFEAVLTAGKLGASTATEYAGLPNGDQGQIREFYLASLERVEPSLRDRYFKLYAYY